MYFQFLSLTIESRHVYYYFENHSRYSFEKRTHNPVDVQHINTFSFKHALNIS